MGLNLCRDRRKHNPYLAYHAGYPKKDDSFNDTEMWRETQDSIVENVLEEIEHVDTEMKPSNGYHGKKMDNADESVYPLQLDVMGKQVEDEDFRAMPFLPIWEDMEQISAFTPKFKKCNSENTQLAHEVSKTLPELFQRSRDNNCAPSSDKVFNSFKMEVVQNVSESLVDSPMNVDSSASKKKSWNAGEDEKSTSERSSNRSEQTMDVKLLNVRSAISENVKPARSTIS